MNKKIKVIKKIHKGWEEWDNLSKEFKKSDRDENEKRAIEGLLKEHPKGYFGKYQYIYKSKKGEISLVLLLNYDFISKEDVWEIYSFGKLFEDVMRFKTKEEAEKEIEKWLS